MEQQEKLLYGLENVSLAIARLEGARENAPIQFQQHRITREQFVGVMEHIDRRLLELRYVQAQFRSQLHQLRISAA